jgi:hypothetical protein
MTRKKTAKTKVSWTEKKTAAARARQYVARIDAMVRSIREWDLTDLTDAQLDRLDAEVGGIIADLKAKVDTRRKSKPTADRIVLAPGRIVSPKDSAAEEEAKT